MVRDLSATTTESASATGDPIEFADALHHPETRMHRVVGQIGGAGEVVCNTAKLDHADFEPWPSVAVRALLNSRMRASTFTPICLYT